VRAVVDRRAFRPLSTDARVRGDRRAIAPVDGTRAVDAHRPTTLEADRTVSGFHSNLTEPWWVGRCAKDAKDRRERPSVMTRAIARSSVRVVGVGGWGDAKGSSRRGRRATRTRAASSRDARSADELDSIIGEGQLFVGEAMYSYGSMTRRLPKRIVLVRHGESEGNVDESAYTRTPDSQVPLTARGHDQAESTGRRLREMMDGDENDYNLFFYISPYRRSKETAIGIAKAFEGRKILGVREEPQLREQDFGNFQDYEMKQAEKQERHRFGRFFYRFPNGESGADVYDRITMFSDHMVRDIDAGRFPEDTNMILCTHGLTLRLFLMRWFHWTVAEYERIANPSNSQPIILERRSPEDIEHSMHTKECYALSQESKEGLRGCSDEMCTMILPEECWSRALQLGPDVNHSLLPPPEAPRPNPDKFSDV